MRAAAQDPKRRRAAALQNLPRTHLRCSVCMSIAAAKGLLSQEGGTQVMVRKFWWAGLVGALILPHVPTNGQSVKEMQSQSFDRPPGSSAITSNNPDLERVKE